MPFCKRVIVAQDTKKPNVKKVLHSGLLLIILMNNNNDPRDKTVLNGSDKARKKFNWAKREFRKIS